jgi:glycosyltransferase involved in cell wall biosynthesis/thymidylate kinase
MIKKIKVGIFVDGDFIASYDGASNRFHYLSRYLALNGVDVVIFHGYRGWSDISLIQKEPFKTYVFPIGPYYGNLELIASLIRKESIDIIQFDNIEPILLQGIRLAELSGAKLVSEMHYVVRDLAKRLGAGESRITEIMNLERKVGRIVDHLICLSDQDAPVLQDYMGIPSQAISVIPSGVDYQEIKFIGPNIQAKNIIFLGNLFFKPNEDAVRTIRYKIYPKLHKYGYRFTIAGDCPPNLKKECETRGFNFIGTLANLNDLFKEATFALAPIEESTGMRIKLLNYLAAGIPIITTKAAATGFDTDECFFFEDDFKKYAAMIVDLSQNEQKLWNVAQKGLMMIRDHYDWNSIAKRVIKTYQKILTDKRIKNFSIVDNNVLKNNEPVWLQEAIEKRRFKTIKNNKLPEDFSYVVIDKNRVEAYKAEKIIAIEGMPGAGKTTFIEHYIRNKTASSLPQLQIYNEDILANDDLETSKYFLKMEESKTRRISELCRDNKEILLDRTYITTLAYCYSRAKVTGRPEEYQSLLNLYNKIMCTITFPTHLVYLDTSINESIRRRKASIHDDRYANWFNPQFLEYLKEFYVVELPKILPLKPLYLDTSAMTPDDVAEYLQRSLSGEVLSVVIPTHKHEKRINDLLDLLRSLVVKSNLKYIREILIIDNGESLMGESRYFELLTYKKVKVINELRIGLNHARNTGIATASAEIIAFLDDDVLVCSSWAEGIVFGHQNIDVLCVGGPVEILNTELRYPSWFSEYFLRFLLPPVFPKISGRLNFPYFLIGANMSFNKKAFEKYGLFDLDLDRKGSNLLSNGDLEFIIRLPQSGVRFEARAVVREEIKKNRMTRLFSVRRVFWQGISDSIMIKKRGLNNFYDKDEVFFTRYFIKKLATTLARGNFFEAVCTLVRLGACKCGIIWLILKKEK